VTGQIDFEEFVALCSKHTGGKGGVGGLFGGQWFKGWLRALAWVPRGGGGGGGGGGAPPKLSGGGGGGPAARGGGGRAAKYATTASLLGVGDGPGGGAASSSASSVEDDEEAQALAAEVGEGRRVVSVVAIANPRGPVVERDAQSENGTARRRRWARCCESSEAGAGPSFPHLGLRRIAQPPPPW